MINGLNVSLVEEKTGSYFVSMDHGQQTEMTEMDEAAGTRTSTDYCSSTDLKTAQRQERSFDESQRYQGFRAI
jgi:hypothetical protein